VEGENLIDGEGIVNTGFGADINANANFVGAETVVEVGNIGGNEFLKEVENFVEAA